MTALGLLSNLEKPKRNPNLDVSYPCRESVYFSGTGYPPPDNNGTRSCQPLGKTGYCLPAWRSTRHAIAELTVGRRVPFLRHDHARRRRLIVVAAE